jgi:predicted ester cyclase
VTGFFAGRVAAAVLAGATVAAADRQKVRNGKVLMAIEQDNGAIVRRFLDLVWNRGELSAIDDLVDDDFTNFGVRQPGGHAGMRHIVTVWRTAFPDIHFEIQEEIVHQDKVVTRGLMRGTHLGEFQQGVGPGRIMGTMAPTGRPFEADQIHIWRVQGGKIVEHSASRNDLLLLNQLGLVSGTQPITEATWRKPVTASASPRSARRR